MLSPTDRCGNSASDWNTMPRLRLCVGSGVMSSPSSTTFPLVGSSSPAIILSNVVLPQPDGPSRHTKLPFGTFSATLSTAVNGPKVLVMALRERPDMSRLLRLDKARIPLPVVHGERVRRRACSLRRKERQPTIISVHF